MKGAQLAKGKLFEDPDFPANKVSLGRWEDQVEWKRPHVRRHTYVHEVKLFFIKTFK